MNEQIETIIQGLKRKKINFFYLPEEYQSNIDIAQYQRRAGKRKISKRGYDVISDKFFVEEIISYEKEKTIVTFFEDFLSYSNFINKHIYENACYYQLDFAKIPISVNQNKLKEKDSYITYTIDDYCLSPSPDELLDYEKSENIKIQCREWTEKFNSCTNSDEFKQLVETYFRSTLNKTVDVSFFFYNYINEDLHDYNRFRIIMEFMSTGRYPTYKTINSLCLVYDSTEVMKNYNFSGGSKSTIYRWKNKLKQFIKEYKDEKIKFSRTAFFDKQTHFFREITEGMYEGYPIVEYQRNFETFEDFIAYRHQDLTHCDLTNLLDLSYDFSSCIMDKTTKLPIVQNNTYRYEIDKRFIDNAFRVSQVWYNENNMEIKRYEHVFTFFFDFVAFLKGDLSNADLSTCDGLQHLIDFRNIIFSDAKIPSTACDKLGINYSKIALNMELIDSFSAVEKDENTTSIVLQANKELINSESESLFLTLIYYISDLHIMHKLLQAEVKSESDAISLIRSIVEKIVEETDYSAFAYRVLLIGGDVSSDWHYFKSFVQILRDELDKKKNRIPVIFVLGNHELWEFTHLSFSHTIEAYKSILQDNGMYLLQNSILHIDDDKTISIIDSNDILTYSDSELREAVLRSRLIFFGGLGFSGYNQEFNANNGIYREAIRREIEIEESSKFYALYQKVSSSLSDRKVIVFTHMPMDCWSPKIEYHNGFIYVSGHTHRNEFHDDGEIRIYRDNQIGYNNKSIHLKCFSVDDTYDVFSEYDDGIYIISRDDYREFYRGKNMHMDFNRDFQTLYLLKRDGYYCFILQSAHGDLSILNGGQKNLLNGYSIEYYYEKMKSVIDYIISQTSPYTKVQEQISAAVCMIGGSGRIHGCIIDMDFYSHIFVDPISGKVTFYWASDIINKIIYPSCNDLLKTHCPVLYDNYKKALKSGENCIIVLSKKNTSISPQLYLATDIYKASREVFKVQKLKNNILTIWVEPNNTQHRLKSPSSLLE